MNTNDRITLSHAHKEVTGKKALTWIREYTDGFTLYNLETGIIGWTKEGKNW